jgi:hypothetical protein
MTATTDWKRLTLAGSLALLLAISTGCQIVPNYYRETGPATEMDWWTPTAKQICQKYDPAPLRSRGWPATSRQPLSGAVYHEPLYLEDPFVTKGHGRTDDTHPRNVYRLGWEDWLAMPYGLSRFTANWLLFPVSAVVTPPWTVMESDGWVSEQFGGWDHDAVPVKSTWLKAPTAGEKRVPALPQESPCEHLGTSPAPQPEAEAPPEPVGESA